jgi:hypothetical protein
VAYKEVDMCESGEIIIMTVNAAATFGATTTKTSMELLLKMMVIKEGLNN